MQRKRLFTENGINHLTAIALYSKAYQEAYDKAYSQSKSFGGEEIGIELSQILEPHLLEMDLIDSVNYAKIQQLIENWSVDSHYLCSSTLHKFAAVQQILMNILPSCRRKQLLSEDYNQRGFDSFLNGKFASAISDSITAISINPKNSSARQNFNFFKNAAIESNRGMEDIKDGLEEPPSRTLRINIK